MPNPQGYNSFNHFAPEPAYGQKTQQDTLQRSAPIPANPAMNAPRRAQKRASTPTRGAPAPASPAVAPPAPVSPQLAGAQAWAEIAALPGASDLVKFYAAKAQQGA